jgi:hypothetical protein
MYSSNVYHDSRLSAGYVNQILQKPQERPLRIIVPAVKLREQNKMQF